MDNRNGSPPSGGELRKELMEAWAEADMWKAEADELQAAINRVVKMIDEFEGRNPWALIALAKARLRAAANPFSKARDA